MLENNQTDLFFIGFENKRVLQVEYVNHSLPYYNTNTKSRIGFLKVANFESKIVCSPFTPNSGFAPGTPVFTHFTSAR